MKPVKVEIAEKFKVKDTYTEKLNLAIAMGFSNLSEAIFSIGLAKFNIQFEEVQNKKAKKWIKDANQPSGSLVPTSPWRR